MCSALSRHDFQPGNKYELSKQTNIKQIPIHTHRHKLNVCELQSSGKKGAEGGGEGRERSWAFVCQRYPLKFKSEQLLLMVESAFF